MRRILVDHARNRKRLKRGGGWQRVAFDVASELSAKDDDDILAVDEALEKLHSIDPIQAKIVELRFFGGLTVADVAEVLKMSKRTVESEWQVTRAWLRRELSSTKSK
jgi:RNA polymerase sigma-70 factor (ECF subfamily)